jgi:hypothetical protein
MATAEPAEQITETINKETVQEPADIETEDEDINEDSLYSAPIPGSLEAIIAASAAAAALRSRAFSDEALEESTSVEQAIAELVEETPIEEPSAEESVEEIPVEEAPIEEIPEEEFVAEAPIPGSLEAIIAANAAAAALRSRAFSDEAVEEVFKQIGVTINFFDPQRITETLEGD